MSASRVFSATCSGPVNIAVLKYWGKASVAANTPTNPSLSVTLHQRDLRTVTTAAASAQFASGAAGSAAADAADDGDRSDAALDALAHSDRLWLNGCEEQIPRDGRVAEVIRSVRRIAAREGDGAAAARLPLRIASINNFPTAAGLASSASGYATLVATLAALMHAEESFPGELTAIARRGSGSACRSLHGGFVKWLRGTADDGWVGSVAQQVQPETHWPALRALVLVACADRKHVGSTLGMQLTVRTSRLFEHRVGSGLCEETLAAFEAAIEARDMARFAELAMRDSNQFHAVCADTYPPIFYMTDTSRRIVRMVHAFNEHAGKVVAGYTFDAGPNAVIYCEEETVPALMRWVLYFFPPPAAAGPLESFFPAAEQVLGAGFDVAGLAAPEGSAKEMGEDRDEGKLSRVIYTSAGPGPIRLDDAEGLLDTTTWEVAK